MKILKQLYSWLKSKYFARDSINTRYALAEACIIGIFSALAALFLKEGISWLEGWRIQAANYYGAKIVLPVGGLTLGIVAGWLIETFAPAASGGGIPRVKAALARIPTPLSLSVAVIKSIGTILILGAGLTLGRRGPTVHIGAALAAQLSNWVPTSPQHRRQMIAAGAAAGLAAGFNTPIAGVLFVVEELMRDISDLTLETAIIASFTGAVVYRIFGSNDLNLSTILDLPRNTFLTSEIPFYIILGIFAGILGGLFNRGILWSGRIYRSLRIQLAWQIGLSGLISGTIIAFLPPVFRDNPGLREFLLAGELNWQTTAFAFFIYFLLTIITAGSGAPGGLFAPALVLGAALGYLVGTAEGNLWNDILSNTYAYAGMGAFFTAVVRVPVTAIVIIFEITGDFNIVLPLMITCAVTYLVAETFFPGSIYQHLLKVSGIVIQENSANIHLLERLKAADVMESNVEFLSSNLTLDLVMNKIASSPHRGFPVLEDRKLVGIITKSDLANLNNIPGDTLLKKMMTPRPITVNPDTSLGDVLYLLSRYKLSRLPVTEGSKLVGIITRTDIIKAEVKHISGFTKSPSKGVPSYVIYQTRSPALGKGRILVPLSNPDNYERLLKIAATMARDYQYELDCLQVIQIPKHKFPNETIVNDSQSRDLMGKIERFGRRFKVLINTQIRVGHDPVNAILEAIEERHIDILLMGWKGSTSNQEAIFSSIVDRLINQAKCKLILVKFGKENHGYPHNVSQKTRWIIPMGGGPNVQEAITLIPCLTTLYNIRNNPELWLCKVANPSQTKPDTEELERASNLLKDLVNLPIKSISIRSYSVSDAIIHLVNSNVCDLVLMGTSREGLLNHAIHGNIPESIAKNVNTTVIFVRSKL